MNKFLIGSSTAAHQVEGNNIHSDYWALENMEYTDFSEKSLDAVNHYKMYKEDIKMMKDAGLNAYRFSIEWARIEPKKGEFDEKEISHYKDVILECKKNDIEPIVTLMHFTSPKWLIDEGGWENPLTVYYFKRYVKKIISSLGQYLNYVCTINEANMGIQVTRIAERYKKQIMAAQSNKSQEGSVQIGMNFDKMMKNMQLKAIESSKVFGTSSPQTFVSGRTTQGDLLVCKAHMEARDAIKSLYPNIKVGLTLSLHDIQVVDNGEENALKEWDDEFLHYIPFIENDDFLGIQNYSRSIISKDGLMPNIKGALLTQMGYENYPSALGHVVSKVYNELHKPILVTENGIATSNDEERCEFIKKALDGLKQSIAQGSEVIGYMHWSFCDNFEWQKGFSMQFGLVQVDRKNNFARHKKPSLDLLGSYTKVFNS
jgi:beta-glucosidase